jgi:4-amino-4-deoxy-L-arabinose transferase-like glycosyltransferase
MSLMSSWPVPARRPLILALLILAAAFLILLFWRGFSDPDEGRYAEIPREMVESGHWLEMRMLGYRYYEKPPLSYWLVAPAIAIFGAHDWAARIPLLLGMVWLLGLFVRRIRRDWPGTPGGAAFLVAASTIGFAAGACLLLTDAFLTVFFAATSLWLYDAFLPETPPLRRLLLVVAAAAAAVAGVLTKGAVAFVLPAGILLLWLTWERRPLALLSPATAAGVAVAFALLVPAFVLIEQHNPEFFRKFIFEEHLARFKGTRGYQGHEEPFHFFGPVILLLMLPWTGFLFRAVRRAWRQRAQRADRLSRYLLVWAVVVVGFFSISTGKLMSYIMPAMFPLGLLLGRWGVADPPDPADAWDRRLWQVGVGIMLLVVAGLAGFWTVAYFQILPDTVFPITGVSVLAIAPALTGAGLAWTFGRFRTFHGSLLLAAGVLLSASLLLSPLAGKDMNVMVHINSSHVYKSLAAVLKPEDRIVVFWDYRPALPFYTRQFYIPFQVVNELNYGMSLEHPSRREVKDMGELVRRTRRIQGRIYALVDPDDLEKKFRPLNLPYRESGLPSDPDTVVFEIFPQQWRPVPDASAPDAKPGPERQSGIGN